MNTHRLAVSFPDRTIAFQEEVTRPVHIPSIAAMVVEPPEPRVWVRPATEETVVTRPKPKKSASLLWLCALSIVIGAVGGYLGREALPFGSKILQRIVVREPRHASIEGGASLVSHTASARVEPSADPPKPTPPRKKSIRVASPTDLEIETSFRIDS